jgi:hypothetical protein
MNTWSRSLVVIGGLALVASCGGGGGDGGNGGGGGGTVTNASVGGIWRGTESASGLSVIGLADEAGEFHFLRSDGVQYVGTANTNGNTVSANFEGFTPFGFAFPDGTTHGTRTLSGTIQERASLSGSTQFTTDLGGKTTGTITLTFDDLYNTDSSLSAISGVYTDPQSGDVISVSGSGDVFWQDAATGCTANGTVAIINAAYDAYRVRFSYGNCTGAAAVLNGVQFSGLGTLDTTASPVQAIIGVTGQSGATKYALVYAINK